MATTRFDITGLCLIAALAGACSSGAIKLRDSAPPVPDGAGEILPDAGAAGSGGTSTSPPDAATAAGGSGGVAGQAGSGGGGAAGQAGSGGGAGNSGMDAPAGGTTTDAGTAGDGSVDAPASDTTTDAGTATGDSSGTAGTGGTVDGGVGTSLTLSTQSLDFGQVEIGRISTPKSVTLAGAGALVAFSPILTGAGFVIDSRNCDIATTSCTVSLMFTPVAVGPASGVLTVAAGLTVFLSGIGLPPGPFSLTLSEVPATRLVNQSAEIFATVTATAAVTDLVCVPSGADLTADAANTTCTGTVSADTPCVYAFTFMATTAGAKTDSIVCNVGGVTKTAPVSVTVVTRASLVITPSQGSFQTIVGTASTAITFAVANAGGSVSGPLTAALAGTNATEFAITDDKCVAPLAPLSICTIQVAYKPTSDGAKTATLTVTDSTASSISATLNGVGVRLSLAITGSQNLGSVVVGQSGTASTYTVTNVGGSATGALTIVSSDAEFAIGSNLCNGLSLAAGGTCTFTVTFSPTSAGVKAAVLSVSFGGTLPAAIQIQATGVPVAADAGP